jgi:nuclear GTP-binding protein
LWFRRHFFFFFFPSLIRPTNQKNPSKMVKNKKASKRVPLNQRYNIHKKALAHDKKQRRLAKANPHMRPKLKKDPGIPNLNPFKAQILKNMEERHKVLKMQERQRALRGQDMARRRKIGDGLDEEEEKPDVSLSSIAADAIARGEAFASAEARADADLLIADGAPASSGNAKAGESTRRAFYRHLRTVMEQADILLCVLDARDPLSCRAPAVEALALSQSPPKRIILVLNKIDLVPASVVQQWLVYLRREFPTVAFKASTQQQRSHLSAPGGGAVNKATEAGEILTGSGAAGADSLLQLIKNYSRSHELKRAVTVGVVGYPNVGKSSIINSLKRSRAVGVSSTPGFTRKTQEVHLDAKVTLLDCPGIIFDDEAGNDVSDRDGGAGLLLRNCISLEQIEDPEAAVDGILKRCAPEKLMSIFSIPHFTSTPEFLLHVAGRRGKLGRGGVPDRVAAARSVLGDWNSGKIPFFVLPPVDESNDLLMSIAPSSSNGAPTSTSGLRVSASDLGESSIVAEWSKVSAFSLKTMHHSQNTRISQQLHFFVVSGR